MSFEITETAVGNLVEVHATGKLTKEAYESFVPKTEAMIKEHGRSVSCSSCMTFMAGARMPCGRT